MVFLYQHFRRCFIMAYKILDTCVSCGACAAECPVDAISQGDTQFVIDADTCIDCGNCANVCPVGAPVQE
ncbi:putative ferredoxin [Clostridium perfringens SM101]|nr:putative ferredoxin [Clostridium perfringens SM101]